MYTYLNIHQRSKSFHCKPLAKKVSGEFCRGSGAFASNLAQALKMLRGVRFQRKETL